MENEFIKGLSGVNIKYTGQHLNHYHICEIWLLGKLFNHRARTIQMYCPQCGLAEALLAMTKEEDKTWYIDKINKNN